MNSIFILGITGRSGTNYLSSILKNHPDCNSAKLGAEDFLIYGLDVANEYVNKVSGKWNNKWKKNANKYGIEFKKDFKHEIGNGIINFTKNQTHHSVQILKTPSTININYFFDFFPKSKLIILLRDGKSVVESGVKSNFWNYQRGFLIWNNSAERILNFQKKNKAQANQFLIVKYENLIISFENEVKRILNFCDLDITKYNFSAENNITLFGTSTKNINNEDDFKWEKKEKPKNFNPLSRANNWKKIKHIRFNYTCGKNAKKLGYELKYSKKNIIYYFINLLYYFIYFYEKVKLKIKPI